MSSVFVIVKLLSPIVIVSGVSALMSSCPTILVAFIKWSELTLNVSVMRLTKIKQIRANTNNIFTQ